MVKLERKIRKDFHPSQDSGGFSGGWGGESERGTGGAGRGALGVWNVLALVVTRVFT